MNEAKEEAKKVAMAGKGKGGRKRKSPEEAGALEPKAIGARTSEAQVEEDETAPEPWKAPAARM